MISEPESGRNPALAVQSVRLSDTIAQHIEQLIADGSLKPGEKLLEDIELSKKLDVSRQPLSEGLDKLVDQGLLYRDAQGVAYVNEGAGKRFTDPLIGLMNDQNARSDLMELRAVIEAAAAGYAAERTSEADREQLRNRMEAMVAAQGGNDIDEIARTDAEFHFTIYEGSHNIMMLQLMRSLEELLRSSVYLNRENLFKHRSNPISQITEHRGIFDAIMERNAEAAREAAHQHMRSSIDTQRSIYEAERRQQASVRRLSRSDLIAMPRVRK